jgi:hypothetical protein
MSTQFVTIDTASCISFAGTEEAEPTHAGASPDKTRLVDSDFFKGKSIAELAHEQGVGPVKDIRVLAGAQLDAMRGSASDPDEAIRARLADVARQEEKRSHLSDFFERDTPAWNPDDHPDIDAAGGAAAWVRKLRSEAEQGFKRRTREQEKE